MSERKEYRITVNNEIVGLEQVGTAPKESQDPSQATERLKKETATSGIGKTMAITMGKQALTYAVSNYGNLTGDYVTQDNIQSAIELIGTVALMATGPVGMVAGVGSMVIKASNRQIEVKKRNQEVEFLRMRTGMMDFSGGRL